MEFEEMRKIWDTQNNEPIYVLNDQALHKRIVIKKNRSSMIANINEVGLIIIAIITSGWLLIKNINGENPYAFLPIIGLLLTGIYVYIKRVERKKLINQFDRTILGDLDQAIANANYHVTFARTFVWWYIAPVAVPLFINMLMNDAPLWKWFFIPATLILSYLVVRYELRKCHIPREESLVKLREKLVKEVDPNSIT